VPKERVLRKCRRGKGVGRGGDLSLQFKRGDKRRSGEWEGTEAGKGPLQVGKKQGESGKCNWGGKVGDWKGGNWCEAKQRVL